MSRDPTLNGMLYFETVARHGGVSKAADELGVSGSAVSQQIKLLEQQLGVRLFFREKRQFRLTADGERLFHSTSVAFRMIRDARHLVARQRERRQLILRVSPSFGMFWLGPRLARFIQQHPSWDLHVDATPDPSDFEREVVDLDVRYGTGDWPGLYVEAILSDHVLPLCSPAYRTQLQEAVGSDGEDPTALLCHARLIDSVKALTRWDGWLKQVGAPPVGDNAHLRFDRSWMAMQLAKRGVGVTLESVTLAYDDLMSGALVPLSTALPVLRYPAYWIMGPSRNQSRRVVQVFCTWLREECAHHEAGTRALMEQFGFRIVERPTPERQGAPALVRPSGS
ncbi:LysR family transcriptional regulator [Roseospira marina]|uniref:LysR family transcriptional regulator n=1 Tax=Roseospira marina TaxID=140057 RepID=A0A5M6IAZ7_9PROT|nr:LysR substrate-binding domain-containing protein [Roseospira marina]KAA5605470.1 LysR family transcriptional regulator [Roseospira marina]MBB4314528.1 DNA-binding transcriptional LysR family regulator [Roseospira marina]MBB5088644.1 DNA-binding transcriptional LysR family regulator [Roseospira marina]